MNKPSFIVIDFETANWLQIPCQVGIVTCEEGKITNRYETLISLPKGVSIDYKFTKIHKIRNQDLIGKPNFFELIPEIKSILTKGYTVIAHNAKFDMMVLKKALKLHDIEPFDFNFACSVDVIRSWFPGKFPRHSLKVLAEELGIKFLHHNALADSEATCEVLLKCFDTQEQFENALTYKKKRYRSFYEYCQS
ncbi:exonuclease domain-containing protein [Spiroplasma turonicum]|uniref:Exonuclease domain-containing protein n=1 Tax=Spiroplasma turonicum TaxID=216946 RepID=A0A0K1P7B0_9MOLU|nr:exonuclease domain-containing protein [Spiroplasma turonicum]AKU79787.1 hypothetical protein STURON_00541 [Spiroplasma turonicum]ALX70805.1 DNA polymerase III subunit epsilon [Spiroplasma turonicum]